MAGIIHALASSATLEIEVPPYPLRWRIRKITTADVASAGAGMLLALRDDVKAIEGGAAPTDSQVLKGLMFQTAIVAAGLVAIFNGETWEAVKVSTTAPSDPETGRLAVADIPPGVVDALFPEILKLSTDGGAAAERLAAFLPGAADVARAG